MAESVGSRAELDRHERIALWRVVEPVTTGEHVADDSLPGNLRQVFVDEKPLVMPERDLTSDQELRVALRGVSGTRGRERPQAEVAEVGQDAVVEQDVGAVQAGD